MKRIQVIIVILVIVFFRWIFLHNSIRAVLDEEYYKDSILALNHFFSIHFKQGIECLFNSSRPGYNIISLLPAGIQGLLYTFFHIDPRNPNSLLIPQIINFIPTFYTLYFFYKIITLYISDSLVIFTTLVCFGFSINSTIYTTNLLPYDYSLSILLGMLYSLLKILSNNTFVTNRYFFNIGMLTACAISIYPGYYFIIPLYYMLILFFLKDHSLIKRIIGCIYMFIGTAIPIMLLQSFSLYAGSNYFLRAASLSKTIVQGSFEEGYIFFLKYMIEVEQSFGIIWLVGVAVFMIILFANFFKRNELTKKYQYIALIVLFFVLEYFYYAYNSYYLHKMVFYGRLLHLFFPIIILATFVVINTFPSIIKKTVSTILLIGAIINISAFYVKASAVAFPLELIDKYKISTTKSTSLFSSDFYFPYITYDSLHNDKPYTLLNMGIYIYPKAYSYIQIQAKDTLEYKLHFQNLYAYQYEGMNIKTRNFFRQHAIYIGVFK
jgi:hypothetical protein